jgi:hypothetical protein
VRPTVGLPRARTPEVDSSRPDDARPHDRTDPGSTSTAFKDEVIIVLAYAYPFLNIMWTMFVFFAFVIWIYLLVMVFGDNFRRTDHNGWAKAGWTVFMIFLPLLGVLVYMIARPSGEATYA